MTLGWTFNVPWMTKMYIQSSKMDSRNTLLRWKRASRVILSEIYLIFIFFLGGAYLYLILAVEKQVLSYHITKKQKIRYTGRDTPSSFNHSDSDYWLGELKYFSKWDNAFIYNYIGVVNVLFSKIIFIISLSRPILIWNLIGIFPRSARGRLDWSSSTYRH